MDACGARRCLKRELVLGAQGKFKRYGRSYVLFRMVSRLCAWSSAWRYRNVRVVRERKIAMAKEIVGRSCDLSVNPQRQDFVHRPFEGGVRGFDKHWRVGS